MAPTCFGNSFAFAQFVSCSSFDMTFSEPELEVLDSDVVEISMTVLGVTGTACGHSVSSFTGCS